MTRNELPFPVATLLRRAKMAKSPKEGHDTAYFAWEASVRLAFAADPPEDVSDLARGSVGHWVRALRLADWTLDAEPVLRAHALFTEVGTGKRSQPRSVSPRKLLDGLPAYRNRVIGHGGQRPQGFYAEAGPMLIAGLEAAWAAGAFLPVGSRLVHVDSVELDTSGTRRARLIDLTGPLPAFEESLEGPAAADLLPRRIYLQQGATFRPLHPWVVYRDDDLRERAYFFSSLGNAAEYLDYGRGEVSSDLSGLPSLEADVRQCFERSRPKEHAPVAADAARVGGDAPAVESPRASTEVTLEPRSAAPSGVRGSSPFYHRTPIVDPAHFFGRKRELDAVLARTAGASKPQCVSVIANRRMGKSSLFRQVVDVKGRELAVGESPMVFAYTSLEGSGSLSVERFFSGLLRTVDKQVRRLGVSAPAARVIGGPAEDTFCEWIEDLSDAGLRIVLLIDEFDAVTMNPNFDVGFFGRLRYLANAFSLAYVTSSIAELADLCHHEEIRQSPFFNVFSTLHLGLLTATEARELLSVESASAGGPFDEDALAFLDELAGCHPFHLQQAGNALWEAAEPQDRRSVRAAFVEDAAPHFRYAIAHLHPAQLAVLAAAATTPADARAIGEVAYLLRRGLLVKRADVAVPFSAAFGEWLVAFVGQAGASVTPTDVTPGPRPPAPAPTPQRPDVETLEAPAPAVPGTVIASRYALLREVGRGGFGVVFEAEDRLLGRKVALKVLRPDRSQGESGTRVRDRFLQEARAASRITHPNVVTIHDMGEHGGDLHVVMELFEGRSLRAILDERSRLPLEEAVPLLAQAASGLAAAHALGVVHRDVKPDNLLVDGAGRLKIVDFGLAFLASQARITTDSKVAMTPRYCSPEQILGEPVDARSDVFSLGCVIYETLTGGYAFDGESVSAVFYRILYQTPPPQVGTSALPERVAALVSRCLARGPDSRPTSCDDVARELHALTR